MKKTLAGGRHWRDRKTCTEPTNDLPDMNCKIWCGGSEWQGRPVIRLSVCAAEATEDDISRAVAAFVSARAEICGEVA